MSKTIKLIGSDVIEKNTIEYSRYILQNQFPSAVDGFKKVRRRLIWALRGEKGTFSGLTLKSLAAKNHPYGDASIYDTAVKMSQRFKIPFILFSLNESDPGTYSGDTAAAAKYTKFSVTPITFDLFFKDIDIATFPMELTEDMMDFEPSYFIPKLPTALLFHNDTIGYGYKSLTFGYPIDVICDMVISYSQFKQKEDKSLLSEWDYSKFFKKLYPIFPIRNRLLNSKQITKEYENGNLSPCAIIEGEIKIKDANTIIILTTAFRNSIVKVKKDLIATLRNKNNPLSASILALEYLADNDIEAKILIRFKRTVNIFEMIEKIKSIIKFTSVIKPFNNYVENDKLVEKTFVDLIKLWYDKRYYSIFGRKRRIQKELYKRIVQLEALIIVTKNTDRVIDIIKHYDEDEALRMLIDEFKLSFYQSKFIYNSKISIISKADSKKLAKEYEQKKKENEELIESFKHIHEEIQEDAKYFKNKYKMEKHNSFIPEYIGVLVVFGQGIINFESFDELYKLISVFKNKKMKIIKYPSCVKSILTASNGKIISHNTDILLPKILNVDDIVINGDKKYTIVTDGEYNYKIKGPYIISDKFTLHTNESVVKGVTNIGKIDDIPVKNIPTRKPFQQGNKTDYIFYFDPPKPNKQYVLISNSDKEKSKLSFHLITDKTKKILTYAGGNTKIFGVFPIEEKNIFLTMANKNIVRIESFDKIKLGKQKKKGKIRNEVHIAIPISKFEVIK